MFTPDGQTTVTCGRSTTNPDGSDGSNAAVPPAIPDDPTTTNDGSTDGSNAAVDPAIPDDPTTANDSSTDSFTDSFNAAVPDNFADPAAFPDQSQDCDQVLKELLFDEHLWRTGASQELYLAEEDEDFDVSYYDSSKLRNCV